MSAALARSRSARTTKPSGRTSSGNGGIGRGRGQRRVGAAERQHPAPRGWPPRAPRSASAGVGAGEALGRAQHEALVAEVERAPAPARGERHLGAHRRGVDVGQRRRRRSPPGSGCATARWRRSSRAPRASAASSAPSAGTSPTTRSVGSVSVPVLSVQTTSTEASDSIALSCCASTPRCAILNAETAAVRLISRIRPSGTRLTIPAVSACTRARRRLGTGSSTEIVQPDRERDRRARPATAAADRWLARAASAGGGRRARWRSARSARLSGPTAVASNSALALDRERARPHRLPGAAHHRLGLAGQVGLVQREPVRADHGRRRRRPGRRRPAAPGRRRRRRSTGTRRSAPVAHHHRLRSDQRGEPVERALGADLLEGADRRCSRPGCPRNSASRQEANAIVSTPNTNRIPLGIVSVLARTMLA